MEFWKENPGLRIGLMLISFLAGLGLLIYGWQQTGQLSGLGLMLVGVILLLAALMIYNKPFETEKRKL